MASELIVEGKLKIADGKIRIDLDQLLSCLGTFFVLAESRYNIAPNIPCGPLSRG
jgi:hypothetical protein